jgi:hypothetical protein
MLILLAILPSTAPSEAMLDKELIAYVFGVDFMLEVGGSISIWSSIRRRNVLCTVSCGYIWVIERIYVYGFAIGMV